MATVHMKNLILGTGKYIFVGAASSLFSQQGTKHFFTRILSYYIINLKFENKNR